MTLLWIIEEWILPAMTSSSSSSSTLSSTVTTSSSASSQHLPWQSATPSTSSSWPIDRSDEEDSKTLYQPSSAPSSSTAHLPSSHIPQRSTTKVSEPEQYVSPYYGAFGSNPARTQRILQQLGGCAPHHY